MNDLTEIGDDEPVPLDKAVRLFFPHAGITKHTLLAEIARGRLEYEQVGRKKLVTRRQIEAMRERCRVPAKEPIDGLEPISAPGFKKGSMDRDLEASKSLHRSIANLKAIAKAKRQKKKEIEAEHYKAAVERFNKK